VPFRLGALLAFAFFFSGFAARADRFLAAMTNSLLGVLNRKRDYRAQDRMGSINSLLGVTCAPWPEQSGREQP
jgi:hypothetical protein